MGEAVDNGIPLAKCNVMTYEGDEWGRPIVSTYTLKRCQDKGLTYQITWTESESFTGETAKRAHNWKDQSLYLAKKVNPVAQFIYN